MIPVFMVVLLMGFNWAALVIFAVASLTDFVDGYIARHYNQTTDLGKFLDPLADKLLTIAAMVMFCEWGVFPGWALMLVLTREFAVTGLRLIAVQKGTVIAAGWSGKVKTASTMIGLCAMMALPGIDILNGVVIGLIVVTTLYSGIEYFIQNGKCLLD
jgi:CDP-diacylglycerol--glycerol-3-phosphate 3-phosphatidyltransferase